MGNGFGLGYMGMDPLPLVLPATTENKMALSLRGYSWTVVHPENTASDPALYGKDTDGPT